MLKSITNIFFSSAACSCKYSWNFFRLQDWFSPLGFSECSMVFEVGVGWKDIKVFKPSVIVCKYYL